MIVPGVPGSDPTVTARIRVVGLIPQSFTAITDTLPLVVPTVVVILVVVELPVQPFGSSHT